MWSLGNVLVQLIKILEGEILEDWGLENLQQEHVDGHMEMDSKSEGTVLHIIPKENL